MHTHVCMYIKKNARTTIYITRTVIYYMVMPCLYYSKFYIILLVPCIDYQTIYRTKS